MILVWKIRHLMLSRSGKCGPYNKLANAKEVIGIILITYM